MRKADLLVLSEIRRSVLAKDGRPRSLRVNAGLTQAEVGETCGVTAEAVSRWESGSRVPRGEPGLRYARLLKQIEEATACPTAS